MDDIRRSHQPQRQDYTAPHYQPGAGQHRPAGLQPPPQPAYHQPVQHQPSHHQSAHHQTVHTKTHRRHGLKIAVLVASPLIVAGIFAAGYTLRSARDANTIPVSVTKAARYDVYFPSPMPAGYTYMKNTATFQIGQVFYKFANGIKRVTVNEQPVGQSKPNLNQLPGYTQFNSPIGKAALGSSFGQPTAVVVTPTTVITMNSTGGVNTADLKAAITNLKNIGQNTDHKS